MDYLTFTKKLDRVTDIGIVSKPENVVVGQAGFLLSSKVFVYISNSVTGTLEDFRRKWYTRGGYRINACSVVNKIGVKTTVFYLLEGEVTIIVPSISMWASSSVPISLSIACTSRQGAE